jgi:5-methylcytosine-specific restriction endonuclease McrA
MSRRQVRSDRLRDPRSSISRRNGSSRPELDTGQWKRIRAAVRRRDGDACVACGSTTKLHVHHVTPARLGGDDSMANLVTLCVAHHRQADAQLRRAEPLSPVRAEHYVDDPEAGVFWGPPDEQTGEPRRWSRPWFDWRSEELERRNR